MCILSMVAMVLFMVLLLVVSGGAVRTFIDLPTIILMLVVIIPMLISTGLFKDFNNGLRLGITKKMPRTVTEIKRAIEAVKLVMTASLVTGIFISIAGMIIVFVNVGDMAVLLPNVSVALIGVIYGIIIYLLLLPFRTILNLKLINYIQE